MRLRKGALMNAMLLASSLFFGEAIIGGLPIYHGEYWANKIRKELGKRKAALEDISALSNDGLYSADDFKRIEDGLVYSTTTFFSPSPINAGASSILNVFTPKDPIKAAANLIYAPYLTQNRPLLNILQAASGYAPIEVNTTNIDERVCQEAASLKCALEDKELYETMSMAADYLASDSGAVWGGVGGFALGTALCALAEKKETE